MQRLSCGVVLTAFSCFKAWCLALETGSVVLSAETSISSGLCRLWQLILDLINFPMFVLSPRESSSCCLSHTHVTPRSFVFADTGVGFSNPGEGANLQVRLGQFNFNRRGDLIEVWSS
ncbi:hypothetical protein Rs2_39906 [Raphanus sativus]|nr:hypothetical protein Rs2_39906 [Raphanus sativus]